MTHSSRVTISATTTKMVTCLGLMDQQKSMLHSRWVVTIWNQLQKVKRLQRGNLKMRMRMRMARKSTFGAPHFRCCVAHSYMNFCRDAKLSWLDADCEVDPESIGPSQPGSLDDDEPRPQNSKLDQASRHAIKQHLRQKIVVERFPGEAANAPVPQSELADPGYDMFLGLDSDPENLNPYAPFKSAMDWSVARWAKT